MTADVLTRSERRTKQRSAITGRPTRADLVDAGFILLLGAQALWGFRTTFDSPRFILVGVAGLVLGVAIAHLANVLKQPWFVVAAMAVVGFFLFGGAVALSSDATGGVAPNRTVLSELAITTVSGWKDLLTTLPPVDGSDQFLVLPYLLGLAIGVTAFTWARRVGHPAWPVASLFVLLALVILLGTLEPAAVVLTGVGFSVVAFLWVALRRRRAMRVIGTGGGMRSQAVIGAVLLGLSAGGGALAGGHLPGADVQRTVLRTYVQPPFDITQFPSPLVGFRKYTQGARKVWDQELFHVTGAPGGSLIRVAVLDDYSGTVWSAAGTSGGTGYNFRKVGQTIDASAPESTAPVTATVTIGAAYAGLADANVWVPSLGYPSSIVFGGRHAAVLADSLRYNPSTGQALAPARFAAGDSVRLTAQPVPAVDKSFAPATSSQMPSDVTEVVNAKAVKWADKKPTPWDQVQAVAAALQAGAYSDGTRSGETQYLPGHGVARTTTFLGRPQIVGNDEQYASTFALMANSLGVPARVVMGAVLPSNGVVRGQDVHAWVELLGSDGQWHVVPTASFMPDRSKTPQQQPRATSKDANAADVPPPNAQRPPGSVDSTFDTTSAKAKPPTLLERLAQLPASFWFLVKLFGIPLLVLTVIVAALALARGVRRRRRRRHGPAPRRLAQGWRDFVDHARDLGIVVPAGLTRSEQAAIVGRPDLAAMADRAVFGWADPDTAAITAYWQEIRRARNQLTRTRGVLRRVTRRFALRGLMTRDLRPVEQLPTPAAAPRARRLSVLFTRKATA